MMRSLGQKDQKDLLFDELAVSDMRQSGQLIVKKPFLGQKSQMTAV
jgi:hypothetical protein